MTGASVMGKTFHTMFSINPLPTDQSCKIANAIFQWLILHSHVIRYPVFSFILVYVNQFFLISSPTSENVIKTKLKD